MAKKAAAALGVALAVFFLPNLPYLKTHVDFLFSSGSVSADASADIETDGSDLLSPDTIAIPHIRLRAPLIYIDETRESVIQEALKGGVVHYAGTALPGEIGNAYYVGHSSDLSWNSGEYKTVFALLPYLKPGHRIYVTDAERNTFAYVVIETRVVRPNDLSVLDQGDGTESLLTLQTSYPLGTALRRLLVIAHLESGEPDVEIEVSSDGSL